MKKNRSIIRSADVISMVRLVSSGGAGSASPSAANPVVSENSTSITTKHGSGMIDHDTELSTHLQGSLLSRLISQMVTTQYHDSFNLEF